LLLLGICFWLDNLEAAFELELEDLLKEFRDDKNADE